MNPKYILLSYIVFISNVAHTQDVIQSNTWQLNADKGIVWQINNNTQLPHNDHMAMSGLSVDMILEWNIDSVGKFHSNPIIRWPMLRTIPDDTHASLQRKFSDNKIPVPLINGQKIVDEKTNSIEIHGVLKVNSSYGEGIESERIIFPSVHSQVIIDLYKLINTSNERIEVQIPKWNTEEYTNPEDGLYGQYIIEQRLIGEGYYTLAPDESIEYSITRSARKATDTPYFGYPKAEYVARKEFINECENKLILETPDTVLNTLFSFSKIRAAESIFSTRGGLMHGPGGYNKYLAAIWANDQAEYVNPFFPFLGIVAGNESAMNSYRHFAIYINSDFKPIPSSIIAEGRSMWNGAGDRGDMAMIAYGAARFALASGNKEWGNELWPLIRWCIEYCNKNKTKEGVIASDTDELEGRFPAGEANLSTSSLYYDALISTALLAHELGKSKDIIKRYNRQAKEIRIAIANYFEAEVEEFDTYQYYQGNDVLRSWICIPLTVGIYDKAEGTVDALFSPRLWTESGLLTQAETHTVWDRSTLYALRGIIASGYVNDGIDKLISFSNTRLLGDHVPYVIEAYPEYNQSHLSAESGLYCRIFIEGLFGIRPTGLHSFECTPQLPNEWNNMSLRNIHAFGLKWDMEITRGGDLVMVVIKDAANKIVYSNSLPNGKKHHAEITK